MDTVVCEICGGGSSSHLIATCARCNASEHCYCMPVLTYVIPREWYCAGCQEYANGCPKPSQGGKTELEKPWHGCDKIKERETAKLHLSQIYPRSPNKFGNAKVKFISSEEVALLSRERPPYVRSRFAVKRSKACPSSPPNTQHSSNLKCISPSRSDLQVQALKRCAAASHDQIQIGDRPSSPPNTQHSSNLKCISPSRSDLQVQALKRCAAASHDQIQIGDISYFAMQQRQPHPLSPPSVNQPSHMKSLFPSRSDMQVPAMKRASRDQAKIQGRPDFAMRQRQVRSASPPHVKQLPNVYYISPNRTEMQVHAMKQSTSASLNQNRDVLLSIDSSLEYTRRPPPKICWMGCFHVFDGGANLNFGEFKAQFPSKVSSRVYDLVKMIPSDLQLELLPRMNDWPKSFETIPPVYEDIGVFFLSNEPDGHGKKHSHLLEASCNYVLRTYIDGLKLLIYSSEVLPHDSQWIDGETYLWGLFVRSKGKSNRQQLGSTKPFCFHEHGSIQQ